MHMKKQTVSDENFILVPQDIIWHNHHPNKKLGFPFGASTICV